MIAEFLLKGFEKRIRPAVAFDPKRCLRSRLHGHACDYCLSSCAKKALTLNSGKIVFNGNQCTGCMVCVAECPNDAFACGFDPSSSLLSVLHAKEKCDPVVLTCGRSALAFKNRIDVPCLGILAEAVLAAMHCVVTRDLYLDVGQCVDCPNKEALGLLHARIGAILGKSRSDAAPRFRFVSEANSQTTESAGQRRFFLRTAANSLRELAGAVSSFSASAPAQEEAAANRHQGKKAPARYRLLREALALLPRDARRERHLLFSYHHSVRADENCDCCPTCTGMCPTGALQRRQEGNGKYLLFISSRCSGCGLCVAFCRKGALALHAGILDEPHVASRIAGSAWEAPGAP